MLLARSYHKLEGSIDIAAKFSKVILNSDTEIARNTDKRHRTAAIFSEGQKWLGKEIAENFKESIGTLGGEEVRS